MIWFLIALGVGFWLFFKSKKKRTRSSGVKLSFEVVRPDPEDFAQEREARKKAKADNISKLVKSFVRPSNFTDALSGLQSAVNLFAEAHGVTPPEIESLWKECQEDSNKKTEQKIRKKMNEAYKLREQNDKLVEALCLCVLHTRFVAENPSSDWKIETSIKRLLTNLKHEKYRSQCIGFLYLFADSVRATSPEIAAFSEEQIESLFSSAYSDDHARLNYDDNLIGLSKAATASDKHFILNALVEYLSKKRRFDPSVREKMIEHCEADIALYKTFLADFSSLGGKKKTFAAAVKSQGYFCPYLPSFNALWELYEEESNTKELQRLHKIAKEIKYGSYQEDSALAAVEVDETVTESPEPIKDPCPVELIEIPKSGKKGKLAFLDSEGNACSTEEAVRDHFENLGYKVLRGEVQFWQAMFALSFWKEIFEGTGSPNEFNDIPTDLFAGEDFYLNRKQKIEDQYSKLQNIDLHKFISGQLGDYGNIWTRIVYSGGRGDFSYREFLESKDLSAFLKVIDTNTFAKMVHRIALNPTENRAGTPDYVIWKDSELSFIEVKGVREKIRDSQITWLSWMHEEKIPVKIVRVKGKNQKVDSAA